MHPYATYATYPSLVDRTVLVTGGATGIGESLVEHFAAQGSRVGFIDIDEAAGRALVARLGQSRTVPLFLHADLTDLKAMQAAIESLRARFGPVTALVNNAANDVRHTVEETTPESWDAGMAVNLKHQFFAAKAVLPDMRAAGGGSIVNLGSVSWMLKIRNLTVYQTAKAAVKGLTRSLARELGTMNIRVNSIVPGWVMTEKQVRLWLDDAGRAELERGQCIHRPLLPEHIARMALFLAADDSDMCTAQDFVVDGGWT
ncbi:MAG TPA: SDR family oxidoreductase [Ramlibacter sp.]|uniref:SDR family NAD(P)-dependent oxidoreductase n=1 Tax=Ramlibacter sp. TaxID=1917967 RepID=UPI002C70814C|nr:SDR family oxidoreductase [Ramlibacter sp.]HVZ45844.1 SDR family oxidoreductase [Ramlibacter sp.]